MTNKLGEIYREILTSFTVSIPIFYSKNIQLAFSQTNPFMRLSFYHCKSTGMFHLIRTMDKNHYARLKHQHWLSLIKILEETSNLWFLLFYDIFMLNILNITTLNYFHSDSFDLVSLGSSCKTSVYLKHWPSGSYYLSYPKSYLSPTLLTPPGFQSLARV